MNLLQDFELYRAIVEDGFLRAKKSVLISTANLKNIRVPTGRRRSKSLVEVLLDLAGRDVFVHLLHASTPSLSFRQEAQRRKLSDNPNIVFFPCPRVHFKAVIVDDRWMYLGSANLTGAGLGAKSEHKRNFEMGFITEDPNLIQTVVARFNQITEKQLCPPCFFYRQCWGAKK